MTVEEPPGDPASAPLDAVFGSWSAEDAEEISTAIEEAFEQVNLDEWE